MSFNDLYKRLFFLALILVPLAWLVLTDDGRRRADLVMLALLTDREPMNIAFAKLRGSATEADFRTDFPDVPLSCEDRSGHFGDRVCSATIAAVGGAPASSVSLYFLDGRLNALKLAYPTAYHTYLLGQLEWELGPPAAGESQAVRYWQTQHGRVLAQAEVAESADSEGHEPSLLWLSNRWLRAQARHMQTRPDVDPTAVIEDRTPRS
jgi:hypothetical protein